MVKRAVKSWEMTEPIFGIPIHLVVSDVDGLTAFYKRRFDIALQTHYSHGKTLFSDDVPLTTVPACVLWFPPEFRHNDPYWQGTLAHETMHMTHKLMAHVGMKFSRSSEETYAYYSGWLFEQAIGRLANRRRAK